MTWWFANLGIDEEEEEEEEGKDDDDVGGVDGENEELHATS